MDDGLLAVYPHGALSEIIMPSRQTGDDGWATVAAEEASEPRSQLPRRNTAAQREENRPTPHFQDSSPKP